MGRRALAAIAVLLCAGSQAWAEPPHASYMFPAGGQRGTKVVARVGGHFLHERCQFEMLGPGVTAPVEIRRTETIWFEGPLIKIPASQAAEDYPQDYAAEITIAADSPPGQRWWRCWNAQGVTQPLPFVVGELPEVVEKEIDGEPIPAIVTLPVTINGRIFPREDSDVWTFEARSGQTLSCAVVARDLGSPLVAKLAVYDPEGKPVAESTGGAAAEAQLRFVAATAGRYSVYISDVAAGGLQNYVYRLTVTDATVVLAAANSAAVFNEAEPNETLAGAKAAIAPGVLGGRIQSPGDIDCWLVELKKGEPVAIESRSLQPTSPLAILLTVRDEKSQQLAELDGSTVASGNPVLNFKPPADGKYVLEIRERFARRGGPQFAYEVAIGPPPADFRLLAPDSVAVDIGTDKKIDVQIERTGDWKSSLTIHVEGLPAGVTCDDATAPPNANKATLTFKCAKDTPVVSASLRITGRAQIGGQQVEHAAVLGGQKKDLLVAQGEALPTRLATTLPTPFKFSGQFSQVFGSRGGILRKHYVIDRGGFAGPLEVRLADRQGRHLQGVTGSVVQVPAEATEFDYPLQLPPWMDLGRTSRTNLMLTGEVNDAAGTAHKVCFTTKEQNEQLIAIVTASSLRLGLSRNAVAIQPSSEVEIPVAIKRDATVTSPITLELVVPRHMQGISARAVTAPAGTDTATLKIKIGEAPGPLNMPLVIRATAERQGETIIGEEPIELIRLP